jgi:hypothetical protein
MARQAGGLGDRRALPLESFPGPLDLAGAHIARGAPACSFPKLLICLKQ